LLYSRKFWLAVVAVAQTVVLHYLKVEPDVWQAIDLLIGVVIAGIAAEDAAAKA
jgi:arginine exporter protein ArgO